MAGVSAAAHGEGRCVLAGDFVVGVDAGLDGGGVSLDVERLCAAHIRQLCAGADGGTDLLCDGVAVGAGGVTAVHGLDHPAIHHGHLAADDGQRAEGAVGAVDAEAHACGGVVQLLDGFQIGALGVVAEAIVQQVVHHQTDGVDSAFRHGSMAGLAPAADADTVAFRLEGDVGGVAQLGDVGGHESAGAVRHSVGGDAAHEVLDDAVADGADQLAVEVALLTIADRELCVRGEAEHRGRVVGEVVVHIVHVSLLVVADEGADGIAQGDALLFEELQGVQGGDHGAFVVSDTAADHPPVADLHLEGVFRPAVALRHHVHMADGSQILLGIGTGQLGVADMVLAVAGRKAHACGQLQRLVQRGTGACAVGCALFRGTLHAVDGHQRGNVFQDLLFVRRNKCVDLLVQSLLHL